MPEKSQEQHHFIVVALIGLTYALAPVMLVLGAVDAWVRGVPGAIALEIASYIWIMWMYRHRHELSTTAASLHYVSMMITLGVITGWWYINDPIPFLFLITAIPIAGVLLGTRGFLGAAVVSATGLGVLGVFHWYEHPEVFDNHFWISTTLASLVIGIVIGGGASRLNEAVRAVPDPVTIRDFRRERQLENQLALAERDRALGGLARAVAHDFNNLLTPIMASAEMASMSVDDPEVRDDLSAIMLAGKEARKLVRTVLEFQRDDSPVEEFDLGDAVDGIFALVTHSSGEGVRFVKELERGMVVSARMSDIQRIVLNLVTNAKAAVGGEGSVTVRVTEDEASPGDPMLVRGRRSPDASIGIIEVSDDGVGMTAEQLDVIFEPFVTHSDGTGLGLATVEEIVSQLGGEIAVWSWPDEGTTVQVSLPVSQA